jgi:dipicolinate synthase subunit A
MKDFIIHQTDERMYYLKELLRGVTPPATTHVFAPNIPLSAAELECVCEKNIVIGGRAGNEALALMNAQDITYFDLMENEEFQAVNARLTASGTLNVIIENSIYSFEDLYALIIGFGRTGAAVARLFAKLDIATDIATNSASRPAHAFAKRTVGSSNFDFTPYNAIINTVPHPIISDKDLMSMRGDAVYIDLASKPALNLDYAKYLGLNADIYPSLPAKACPLSAAKAMQKYISEVL